MTDLSSVEVRRSLINGRGLFALKKLPGRRKLGELAGRLVKLPQGRREIAGRRKIYFIELNDRIALECSKGNSFKHLNHCCAPNCYLRIFRLRVEVYTLRVIRAGEELTVDYGATPHRNGMRCTCGAPNCRGIL